jgi:hypothetical protein
MSECFLELATGVPGKRHFCGCWGGRDLLRYSIAPAEYPNTVFTLLTLYATGL